MRILSHYFVARFLGLFCAVLFAALCLLSTVELILNLEDLSRLGPSLEIAESGPVPEWLAALGIRLAADYLTDLLPITSFVAMFFALAVSARANELLAAQAGGVRLLRVVGPMLLAALILSLGSGVLHETAGLAAQRAGFAGRLAADPSGALPEGASWVQRGRRLSHVAAADPATGAISGIEIFERGPDGSVERALLAARGRMLAGGRWQLEDVREWRFDPDEADVPPGFQHHASLRLEREGAGERAHWSSEPALLPLGALVQHLEKPPSDETPARRRRLRNRLHTRLAEPWLVALFAFAALPFGLRVAERGRVTRPALLGVVFLSGFFLVRSAGIRLAQEELFPVGLAPWLAMGLFALGTLIALRRTPI